MAETLLIAPILCLFILIVVLIKPTWIVPLLVIGIIFVPTVHGSLAELTLGHFWLVLLCFGVFLAAFLERRPTRKVNLLVVSDPAPLVFALLAVTFLHGLNVILGEITLDNYIRGAAGFLPFFLFWPALRLTGGDRIKGFAYAVIVSGVAYSIENFYYFIFEVGWGQAGRVTGVNPNHAVPLPVLGSVFALGLAVSEERSAARRFFLVCCALLCAISNMATETRSLVVANAAGWLLVLLSHKQWTVRRKVFALAACFLIGFLLVQWEPLSRRWKVFEQHGPTVATVVRGDENINYRLREVEYMWNYFQESPLLGHGIGFRFHDPYFFLDPEGSGFVSLHNSLATFGLMAGTVGILIYCWFWFVTLRLGWLNWRQKEPDRFANVLACSLLAILIYSLTFSAFRILQVNAVVAIGLAALSNRVLLPTSPTTPRRQVVPAREA